MTLISIICHIHICIELLPEADMKLRVQMFVDIQTSHQYVIVEELIL